MINTRQMARVQKIDKTLPRGEAGRASARNRAAQSNGQGIPAATVTFRATLTHTSNEYLIDRLPVNGLVKIHERDVFGRCQFVTFMPDPEPGRNTSFVEVPEAEFSVLANR